MIVIIIELWIIGITLVFSGFSLRSHSVRKILLTQNKIKQFRQSLRSMWAEDYVEAFAFTIFARYDIQEYERDIRIGDVMLRVGFFTIGVLIFKHLFF